MEGQKQMMKDKLDWCELGLTGLDLGFREPKNPHLKRRDQALGVYEVSQARRPGLKPKASKPSPDTVSENSSQQFCGLGIHRYKTSATLGKSDFSSPSFARVYA